MKNLRCVCVYVYIICLLLITEYVIECFTKLFTKLAHQLECKSIHSKNKKANEQIS